MRLVAPDAPPLVLASASPTRRRLLEAAGVPVAVDPAEVDEAALRADLAGRGATAEQAALTLAAAKAAAVAGRHPPDALVLGADQILELDGRWPSKPASLEEARAQLRELRGRSHRLVTAAVLLRGGREVWRTVDVAELAMRLFSDAFLEAYLREVGEDVLGSVGCYRLEGPGAQLFAGVRGDHFTILGLPLLPLLEALRRLGVLME